MIEKYKYKKKKTKIGFLILMNWNSLKIWNSQQQGEVPTSSSSDKYSVDCGLGIASQNFI